jgi:hypothetical protein
VKDLASVPDVSSALQLVRQVCRGSSAAFYTTEKQSLRRVFVMTFRTLFSFFSFIIQTYVLFCNVC